MTKPRKNYYTVLTKERIDKLYQELSRGVPIRHACTIAGMSKETYYHWIKEVEQLPEDKELWTEKEELLAYFEEKRQEGLAMAVASRVEKIRVDNSWQSAAWWLERMAYEDFGKKQTVDANVNAKVKTADISKFFDDDKISKILDEESTDDID